MRNASRFSEVSIWVVDAAPTLPSPQFLYDSKTSQLSLNVSLWADPFPRHVVLAFGSNSSVRIHNSSLLVTWEGGTDTPGVYDLEFLKYFRQVVMECHRHSISVFVDPHQDVVKIYGWFGTLCSSEARGFQSFH